MVFVGLGGRRANAGSITSTASLSTSTEAEKKLRKRHRAEQRFRMYGIAAILFAIAFLVFLFGSIFSKGWTAFLQTSIKLPIDFSQEVINPSGNPADEDELFQANYVKLAREALYKELCDLRTHGITKQGLEQSDGPWYYEQRVLGFNYRITDIQCALGTSQMRKLPAFIARRREIARRYDAAFAAHASVVRPLTVAAGSDSAYHLYVVRLVARDGEDEAGVAARRKALYLALAEQKIYTQVHYIPVHRQPDFRRAGMGHEHLPGASAYYASCLSLPMFPAMTDADVDRVVESVVRAAG